MESLPYVDEHAEPVDAPPAAVWAAIPRVLRGLPVAAPIASLLGCDPVTGTAEFDGRAGEAVPGFRVVEADEGRRLVLRGRHRFAEYTLTFLLDGGRLRARTHAAFPGLSGRLYRAAVIGTGAHAIVTRRMLRRIARAA